MFRTQVCLALLLFLPTFGSGQDEKKIARAKEVRAEIAALKEKLAKLEKELVGLDGHPYIGPIKKVGTREIYSLKTGDVGHLGDDVFTVSRIGLVFGNNTDFAIFRYASFEFMVTGLPLKSLNLTQGSPVQFKGAWRVGDPGRLSSEARTYSLIRPYDGAEIIPK